jgi:hypothetical protein
MAQEDVAMSCKLIEALEKFYEVDGNVDGFKKQMQCASWLRPTANERK